jgi:kinesin family protein 6/9
MVVCDTEEDALNCLFEGELARTVSSHQLNQRSSRSHTVFTLHIESRSRVESSDKVVYSKLHLVDLAGSERTKKTGSSGLTLKEATFINKSLSFLEQVVIALSSSTRDHIPYRQSKLTNLLRDSLGGNCKTVMVANVWPEGSHLEETVSTLKFATRMMRVSNEAIVNISMDKHLMIKRYEKEIRDLKQELAMHDTLKNRGRITYD